MRQNIIISKQFKSELATAISECEKDKIFVLVDETTREMCWELIKDDFCLKQAQVITIGRLIAVRRLTHWLLYGKHCSREEPHATHC